MAGLLLLRKCPCLRPKIEEEVRVLDYRHCSLTDVPGDVFNYERTLEELYTDSNQIRDLPRELFYCHGLRKLSISDNEITNIPPAIASLDHLEELDFSKNGIIDVPDNIKCCKYLRVIDASVNPLGKLPEGFTQLQNLTHLCVNDTFLDYLPGSFGRLVKLKILEIRENHLKTLPKSFGRLTELERLDIGNNEFTELPDVIGSLTNLLELWCDNNQITSITHTIGALKQLMFLDASKNQLESLPGEIEGCTCLADLHLSANQLQTMPDAIGHLSNLTTLKADDNQLTSLPKTLGGLTSLSELNVSVNDLEELPASIGLLRNLRTFYADENLLTFVPAELGSCSGITVLSLRSNKLAYIPDEIGRIPRLRVLNLSDNHLSYLPFTIIKLKELQALWLTENQTRPLIPLQSDYEPDTGRKFLTCYLLPQGQNSDNDDNGGDGDTDSFHASIWDEERLSRQQIHFNFADDDDDEGHLVRCPTPYPKEMREKSRHMRNLAMRQSSGDGAQAASWSPRAENMQSVPPEGRANYSTEETIDVRVRDARISKPQSPSLKETHRLYHCDKEKLMKDKARMQHRHSMPNIADEVQSTSTTGTPRSVKRGKKISYNSDTDDVRVTGRRKSTPNLFSFEEGQGSEVTPKQMPSFTYEDLYQKQLLNKHHHHGRRSRRMREYDSDTGYRSDREMQQFQRQYSGEGRDDMSVRSQPTMSRSHRRSHGREGGYASDLEAYAGRGRGWGSGSSSSKGRGSAPSPTPKPSMYPLYPTHSLPQDLNAHARTPTGPGQDFSSSHLHPPSRLTAPNSRPNSASYQQHPGGPPSPSQFHSGEALDQSTPLSTQAPQSFPQGGTVPSSASQAFPGSPGSAAYPQSTPVGDLSISSGYSQSGARSKEKDVHRELYTVLEERNKKPAMPLDSRPSPTPSATRNPLTSQTPPPYQPAPPYRPQSDRAADRSDSFNSSSQSSPRDSGKAGSSFSNPEYTAIQYSSKGREDRTDGRNVAGGCDYETVASVHRGADVQYSLSAGQPQQQQQHRTSNQHGYGQGSRTRGGSGQSSSDHHMRSENRLSGQDYSVSSHTSAATASGGGSHDPRSLNPYSTYSSSRDNLAPAKPTHLDTSVRRSPNTLDLSTLPRPRSGSRENVLDGATGGASVTPQKVFEAYPNPYGEPLEVGDPLMSRYEDVAMFKSMQEPSSQVSSSTDSGYGHGHHIYERIGDFNARRSGSPQSSTPPSHRNTPVQRHNSSSQGIPSRETTPVKEEGFYSVQGNTVTAGTSQESREVFRTVVRKNPGLGFSIAGGQGSRGYNPYRAGDQGIFVTKVQPGGPAATVIQPGDKILQVNHIDFRTIDHSQAVNVMKTATTVELLVERVQKINMV
ncbi:leucine-rich repeat-containing protein 7-like isoform X2 [Littorina saxatilis]|uniref:leucine-rich repeat-containing protein 7-like isoform X2 n=1 Tax=Littorina saxatilis TaxID=31220 RepID=UPI0038B52E27